MRRLGILLLGLLMIGEFSSPSPPLSLRINLMNGYRFGADVLTWTQCTTTREYLRYGLMQSSGYHIVTGAGLLFFSAIGKPSGVAFVRPPFLFSLTRIHL
jgi:hypothetical protein